MDDLHAGMRLALELMQDAQPLLRRQSEALGPGIGIATGHLTIGAIQGAGRFEYVAVGNAMNLAARLCQRAQAGEVLCDRRTREALAEGSGLDVQPREPEQFKGFDAPVPVYALSAGFER